MIAILQVSDLTKDFGGLRAVDQLSLEVPAGQIIGLIGPNGSGKSTLLNMIAGGIKATSGKIHFNGKDITALEPDAIFQLGLARGFQDPSLFFRMTVLDNTLLPIKHQRGEKPWYAPWRRTWLRQEQAHAKAASDELQDVLLRGLYNRQAADLSGGQMKLLEMARSLISSPTLLLLDEPTAGVAPALAYEIFDRIEALRREQGITFVIIEHRLDILFNFVDRVHVMHMGRLLASGPPAEIAANAEVREIYFGE
jgi:branched-chain amino acid transport system ATP-binding protein